MAVLRFTDASEWTFSTRLTKAEARSLADLLIEQAAELADPEDPHDS